MSGIKYTVGHNVVIEDENGVAVDGIVIEVDDKDTELDPQFLVSIGDGSDSLWCSEWDFLN